MRSLLFSHRDGGWRVMKSRVYQSGAKYMFGSGDVLGIPRYVRDSTKESRNAGCHFALDSK